MSRIIKSNGKVLESENSRTMLTVSEKVENHPKKCNQFLAAILANLAGLCLGMSLVWTSPALPLLEGTQSYIQITKEQGAWIGSIINIGACLGAIPTGSLANSVGRKRTLQLVSLPYLVSWLIIAYGNSVPALYIARFFAGLGVGGASVVAPMYVAEIAHTSIRGTLGTLFQVMVTIGILIEYVFGGIISSFHYLALASAFFPLIFLMTVSFMPETPIYLHGRQRDQEAKRALRFLRGEAYNVDEELVKISEEIKEASINKGSLSDLLSSRATLNGMVVSMGLMGFQQMSGINAVLFYAGNIFAESGTSMSPDACTILVGAVMVAATTLSTLLVDKAGRKILLFLSSLTMCLSLVVLGIYFHMKQHHDLSFLSILPLLSLALFIIMFSVGSGPIPWTMLGELFTPATKGTASSLSAAFSWTLSFTVTNQFEHLNDALGTGMTFVVFGWICGMGAIFVALFVPETKGKEVDEVQDLLMKNRALNCNCSRA